MSRSELLFFLCIAMAILLFGIVLPLWEAFHNSSVSSSPSATSKKKKKKKTKKKKKQQIQMVWHSSKNDHYHNWDHPFENDDACQLKIYVPGTGVVLLSGNDANDSNYCSSSSSSSSSSFDSLSSRFSSSCNNGGSSSPNNCMHIRPGSSVGSNHSSSCGSWCMETIEESEEEDVIDGNENEGDDANYGCDKYCPDLDETTAEDEDDY